MSVSVARSSQFLTLVLGMLVLAADAGADPVKSQPQPYDGPIFDAHVHYNRTSWDEFQVKDVIGNWNAAGVRRSLVSSTPDDGTLKLLDAAPDRVVPFFRPYITATTLGAWYKMPELVAYTKERLDRGLHVGLGEVHLVRPENVETPTVREHLRMAAARGLYIQPHSDAAVLEAILKAEPEIKVIWVHAGFHESAAAVGAMLDAHENVWAELSLREKDIMDGDQLDPAWRDLLIRHADRFLVGTDTYIAERWHEYEALVAGQRVWLSLLPMDVTELIAHKNAERLFGP
ncbi:MAG: amidohydrolase family protein [Rhodospirillaceae bacterium]|jgi:hypothetical protein|nr:amidohydrolase family protein [Rhodospirillaceae bacterium]MBT4220338.1 amidohydrolase family protein [Rhodospirillaceae bacterium]MBT4464383.1 amidohydrolase family protein [Rhodospirillaceae bacterium]MBT5013876.1 amidohydrolase family protein [Rhodospirillaceae bacterium]MBT5307701.1 amidohydrolase family protein [Rhodospirillaceae bacterium]